MVRKLGSLGFSLTLIISVANASAAELPKSGLARLVELAEGNSPAIRRSKLALEQTRLELKTARARFFPSVDIATEHGLRDRYPDPDARPTAAVSSLKLSATEKLYDNGETLTNYKIAALKLERQQLLYEIERDDQLIKIANTYFDWSASWQDRQISNNKRDSLRQQFSSLEALYKQGLKTKRDVLRIETELRRIQIDLLRRDNDLENLLEKLSSQTGISREALRKNGISAEEAALTAPIPAGPWPELRGMENRRARIYRMENRETEYQSRLIERKYWPTVELKGEIYDKYGDYLDRGLSFYDTREQGWSALITINYNIWDWGIRRRDLEVSRVKEKSTQARNEQAVLDLDVTLRDVVLRLNEFSESARLTKELLSIEQQSYDILRAEYRNGRATYLDLITNLNSLYDARSRFASTYFALRKQQVAYAYHKGTIYEALKSK